MWAPISAAILVAKPRYLASLAISLPTAVIASTGIPISSASLTNLPRFEIVLSSFFSPTKIDMPTPTAFNLKASFIDVVISSFDSSPSTLGPPDTLKKIGVVVVGLIQFLRSPLVTNKQSEYGNKGVIVSLGFFNPVVGP